MIALIDSDVLSYSIPFSLEEKGTLKGGKWKVRESLDRMLRKIMEETKASSFKLFYSGKGNFRDGIATISPYKGNRKSAKPLLYPYFRELIRDEYGAIEAQGMEADDSISMEQWKDKQGTIICSLDKDFLQCAGTHYTWPIRRQGKVVRPSSLFTVDELEAVTHLYTQAITGDKVDNILYADGKKVAFKGKGEKYAEKLLEGIQDEAEAKARVMEFYYTEWLPDEMGIGWKDAFYEVMNLLYLLRYEGDKYEN